MKNHGGNADMAMMEGTLQVLSRLENSQHSQITVPLALYHQAHTGGVSWHRNS
jgi:hypothetical protein